MTHERPPTGWPLWLRLICLTGGLALWGWIIGGGIPAGVRWLAEVLV